MITLKVHERKKKNNNNHQRSSSDSFLFSLPPFFQMTAWVNLSPWLYCWVQAPLHSQSKTRSRNPSRSLGKHTLVIWCQRDTVKKHVVIYILDLLFYRDVAIHFGLKKILIMPPKELTAFLFLLYLCLEILPL